MTIERTRVFAINDCKSAWMLGQEGKNLYISLTIVALVSDRLDDKVPHIRRQNGRASNNGGNRTREVCRDMPGQ